MGTLPVLLKDNYLNFLLDFSRKVNPLGSFGTGKISLGTTEAIYRYSSLPGWRRKELENISGPGMDMHIHSLGWMFDLTCKEQAHN